MLKLIQIMVVFIIVVFLELLRNPMPPSTEASTSTSTKKRSTSVHPSLDASAGVGYGAELLELQTFLRDTRTSRVQTLFLQGTYNPYTRFQAFPPTHLNLNYLFDPRAFRFSRAYDPLYDEHSEGPAENRADQLRVPDLSHVVFDPNLHPVPKEKKDVWKTVIDFYRNDNV